MTGELRHGISVGGRGRLEGVNVTKISLRLLTVGILCMDEESEGDGVCLSQSDS